MQHATPTTPIFYAVIKKLIDITGSIAMGVITVISVPIIWTLQGFEGPGPLFISQERLGLNGKHIKTTKFRSMHKNDDGAWKGEGANTVTKVGAFLRKTSLDEFPQFWNVLKGEMSLIGPRNDMVVLGGRLASALPNYNFRYAVTPGITGWAQINQQYEQGNISPQSIEETKMRLAYDFYYLKHRSLGLDLVIALKTFKRMFFRVSSW
jgi:lipopolysaccharide/colanic/teichoic acid biosynthesis glycosyltransferase